MTFALLPPAVQLCVRMAAQQLGLLPSDILSPTRGRVDIAETRMVTMALMRRQLGLSYPAIGQYLGRDHTTVMHGCQTVEERGDLGARVVALMDHIGNLAAREGASKSVQRRVAVQVRVGGGQ